VVLNCLKPPIYFEQNNEGRGGRRRKKHTRLLSGTALGVPLNNWGIPT
jgi:hypothetical protein